MSSGLANVVARLTVPVLVRAHEIGYLGHVDRSGPERRGLLDMLMPRPSFRPMWRRSSAIPICSEPTPISTLRRLTSFAAQ
jgi:hypothetical protein